VNRLFRPLAVAAIAAVALAAIAAPPLARAEQSPFSFNPAQLGWSLTKHYFTVTSAAAAIQIGSLGQHTLMGFSWINPNGVEYVKFYDAATAPVCGAAAPAPQPLLTRQIPATNNKGAIIMAQFSSGVWACVTGALADSDTTTISAGTEIDFYVK
jgi:hypothetical protein